jgi:predicted RNA-binding protein with PIN domain
MKKNCREIVIDGYNLLHKIYPAGAAPSFQVLRSGTEEILTCYRQKKQRHITIVYDGGNSRKGSSSRSSIQVVFTPAGTSADHWIIEHIRTLKANAEMVTIVSSDREIRQYIKAFGAAWMSSESFVEELRKEGCMSSSPPRSKKEGSSGPAQKFSQRPLSEREVEQWAALFNTEK